MIRFFTKGGSFSEGLLNIFLLYIHIDESLKVLHLLLKNTYDRVVYYYISDRIVAALLTSQVDKVDHEIFAQLVSLLFITDKKVQNDLSTDLVQLDVMIT